MPVITSLYKFDYSLRYLKKNFTRQYIVNHDKIVKLFYRIGVVCNTVNIAIL